jgi:hypothetical protein
MPDLLSFFLDILQRLRSVLVKLEEDVVRRISTLVMMERRHDER